MMMMGVEIVDKFGREKRDDGCICILISHVSDILVLYQETSQHSLVGPGVRQPLRDIFNLKFLTNLLSVLINGEQKCRGLFKQSLICSRKL